MRGYYESRVLRIGSQTQCADQTKNVSLLGSDWGCVQYVDSLAVQTNSTVRN
jgi:hypothetical protein